MIIREPMSEIILMLNIFHFQLEDWWLNVAYLDLRIATQIHCNMGGPAPFIEHFWPSKEGTQIERACINIWHTLKFWELLRE